MSAASPQTSTTIYISAGGEAFGEVAGPLWTRLDDGDKDAYKDARPWWLRGTESQDWSHPTETRNLDGLRGLVTDVHLSPSWTHACKYSEGKPTVQLILGTDQTSLSHEMGPGRTTRFYLLGCQGGTLAIEVPDFSMGKHLAEYARMVKTFRFDKQQRPIAPAVAVPRTNHE